MGLIASLAGARVTHARIHIPAWGCWFASVDVDGALDVTGAVDLKVADLTLRGCVVSGGPEKEKGRSHYRIVGGAGGWGRTIKAKSYANDAGVKLSTILGDAAKTVGETIQIGTDRRVGPAFTRPEGPASRVLEALSPSAWYVDEAGVTRLGRRAASTLPASVPRVSPLDKARASITLGSDSIAGILPGVVVDGLEAVDVMHEISPSGIRSYVWGKRAGLTGSRMIDAIRAVVDALDPDRQFRGVFEYRVVTQAGKRLNLQPVRVSSGMPDLQNVSAWPGIPGAEADVALGSRVLVGFIDNEPARPYVAAYEDAEGEGFVPTTLTFAQGVAGVARLGDTITLSAITATAGGDPVVLVTGSGTISSASTKVRCG